GGLEPGLARAAYTRVVPHLHRKLIAAAPGDLKGSGGEGEVQCVGADLALVRAVPAGVPDSLPLAFLVNALDDDLDVEVFAGVEFLFIEHELVDLHGVYTVLVETGGALFEEAADKRPDYGQVGLEPAGRDDADRKQQDHEQQGCALGAALLLVL